MNIVGGLVAIALLYVAYSITPAGNYALLAVNLLAALAVGNLISSYDD